MRPRKLGQSVVDLTANFSGTSPRRANVLLPKYVLLETTLRTRSFSRSVLRGVARAACIRI